MIRRLIRISIYTLLIAIVAVLVTALVLYNRTPGWYRPLTELSEADKDQARTQFMGEISDFYTRGNFNPAEEPIVHTLTQEQANRFLLVLMDPRLRDSLESNLNLHVSLPPDISDPMIVFDEDRMILAVRHARLGDRCVSLHLRLAVDDGGVQVAIESIQVGSLPLPQQYVRDQVSEIRYRLAEAADRVAQQGEEGEDVHVGRDLARLAATFFRAIDGEPMGRSFTSRNFGGREVRVERIALSEGKMELVFVPLGPPAEGGRPERPPMEVGGPRERPDL